MINQIRQILHKLGVDLVYYKPEYDPAYSLVKLLEHSKTNLFVDIGANIGQTGVSLIEHGYSNHTVSFEPLTEAYKKLASEAANHKNWKAINCAIGDKDGDIEINVSENLQSSSFLPMLPVHTNADPKSKYVGREKVKIYKLDTILPKYTKKNQNVFIKMDAQGYTDKILTGAKRSLKKALGVQIEMSLVPLYKGEKTYKETLKKMEAMGFELYQLYPGFTDPSTGRLLQFDGVFLSKTFLAK